MLDLNEEENEYNRESAGGGTDGDSDILEMTEQFRKQIESMNMGK